MNLVDILILLGLGALVGWALGSIRKNRKKGGCTGDCSHCGGCRF